MEHLTPIGLGTMGIEDPDAIATALELGYTHLDTAQIYGNEDVVGEGIRRSGVSREDVFLATKVWADSLGAGEVRPSVEGSLEKLGVESVDLLYVHRPIETYEPSTTLPQFDALRDDGLTEHVGVSNFTPAELDVARETLDAPVFAHQAERHPLFQSRDLLAHAREHEYHLVAYSPLVAGDADAVPELVEVAEKHGVTPEQASLAWVVSTESVVAIPKASAPEHQAANLDAADLALADEDIERIDGIERETELFPE